MLQCVIQLTIEPTGSLRLAHLVHGEVRLSHDLGEVLPVSRPHASRHIQIRRSAAGAERLGHVGLHGTVQADGAEAVVGVDMGVEIVHPGAIVLAEEHVGVVVDAFVAVEEDRGSDVAHAFLGEAARLVVEDLRDI